MLGESENAEDDVCRYLAICRPLSPLARSSTVQARKVICCIWIISSCSAAPWAFFTKVNYLTYNGKMVEKSAWCSMDFTEEGLTSLYMMLASTFVFFLAPMAVLVALYAR